MTRKAPVWIGFGRKEKEDLEVLDSEVERAHSCIRNYVRSRRGEKEESFSNILAEFYSEALELNEEDRVIKSSLARCFKKLMRKHNVSEPRHQKIMGDFVLG
jgi:hypothetical protein